MNIPKEVRLRTVVILLSSLLVLSSVSIYYAFSASTPTSGLTDIYIEPPMMESSYSIGIYTSPSTCYLKNGTDGDIETTGTFYACLYAATEALTTGGKILIRSGYYNQTLPITITHDGIYIEGEGQGLGYDYGVQIEWGYTAGAMFYYGDPATTHHFYGGLKGISFIGNSLTNTYAVSIQSYFSDLTFEDCGFFSFDSSVVIQGYGTSGETKNWNFFFSRCDFETNLNAGIYFTNTNDLTLRHVDRVKISECHFYGNKNSILCDTQYVFHVTFTDNTVQAEKQACINVTSGGRQWIVTDNHIFDCGIGANGTMAGIMVNGTGTFYPDSWLIENNIIANHFTSAPVALNNSVWLTGTVRNFAIQNNYFYVAGEGVRLSGLVLTSDPLLVIKDNVGNYNNTVTSWNMGFGAEPSSASYVIFRDSTYIYLMNGSTSKIDYYSTNASKLINFAFANLTSGGAVFLKGGSYLLNGSVQISSNQTLDGEKTAILTIPNGMNAPVIDAIGTVRTNIQIRNIEVDGNRYGQTIGVYTNGIQLYDVNNSLVENVFVHDCRRYGIFVGGGAYGASHNSIINCVAQDNDWDAIDIGANGVNGVNWCNQSMVSGNHIYRSSDVGIGINGAFNTINDNQIDNCTSTGRGSAGSNMGIDIAYGGNNLIDNNIVKHCPNGIYNEGLSYGNNTISNNKVYCESAQAVGGSGIWISSNDSLINDNYIDLTKVGKDYQYAIYCSGSRNTITANTVQLNQTADQYGIGIDNCIGNLVEENSIYYRTAIRLVNAAVNNTISNNKFFGTVTGVSLTAATSFNVVEFNRFKYGATYNVINSNTTNLIRWNEGYKTEASGNATITVGSTSIVVTHNLVSDPAIVLITPTNSTILIIPSVSSKGATTFTISGGSGSGDYYWYAQTWSYP